MKRWADKCCLGSLARGGSVKLASTIAMSVVWGIAKAQLGFNFCPDVTSSTGILAVLEMMSARRLRWFGSRCCTTTNAMPVLAGNALKNSVYASNPPADAPIATTGKESACAASLDGGSSPTGEDSDLSWRAFSSAPGLLFPARPTERNVLAPILLGSGDISQ